MSVTLKFAVQVFRQVDGCIVRGTRIPAQSASDAIKTAAALIPTVPFTAALRLTVDATGEVWTTDVIGQFGEIPDHFAESLLSE